MIEKCEVPPEGWECSRGKGHEGACAARPMRLVPKDLTDEEIRQIAEEHNALIVCTGEGDYNDNVDSIIKFTRDIIERVAPSKDAEVDENGFLEIGVVTEDVAWQGWTVSTTGPWNSLVGAKVYMQTRGDVSLSPAQWADVYYYARAANLSEFIARAQGVFSGAVGVEARAFDIVSQAEAKAVPPRITPEHYEQLAKTQKLIDESEKEREARAERRAERRAQHEGKQ